MTFPLWAPAAIFGAILGIYGLFAAARERRAAHASDLGHVALPRKRA